MAKSSNRPASGISVIIATRLGATRLSRALDSLAAQTLDRRRYELVVVMNGPPDGSDELVRSFAQAHDALSVKVLDAGETGPGAARNAGLRQASFPYFTIVDDDDWVSPNYLEQLLAHCSEHSIAATYLCDIADDPDVKSLRFDNYISRSLARYEGLEIRPDQAAVTSANAGKAAPAWLFPETSFSETLASGEDVLFWSEVFTRHNLTVNVLPIRSRAFYYRRVRQGSISRQYDARFVADRQAVADTLRVLWRNNPNHRPMLGRALIGQAQHLGNVAYEEPGRIQELAGIVRAWGQPEALSEFNHRAAHRLAVCYVYTPYNDASAITAAKRLAQWEQPFDVISHSMGTWRVVDDSTLLIDKDWRGRHQRLPGQPSSTSSDRLAEFCASGQRVWKDLTRDRPPYDSLYSRVQWPFSNALAALIKVRQPVIHWTAEFSDPLAVDADGRVRPGVLGVFPERLDIDAASRAAGFDDLPDPTICQWIEHITYSLADRIVFTNENQREYMIQQITDHNLAERVLRISTVEPQPPVPAHLLPTARRLRDDHLGKRVNIGYFGRVYASRGVGEILDAIAHITPELRRRVRLNLFMPGNQVKQVKAEIRSRNLRGIVRLGPILPYTDFLSTASRMDWLLVVDTQTESVFPINPYLPSKYAECANLGPKIWGMVEPGSALSKSKLDLSSSLNNPTETGAALRSLLDFAVRDG